MQADTQTAPVSKKMLWAGWIISILPVLMLLMSGVMKLVKPDFVVDSFRDLGWPESLALCLGDPGDFLYRRLSDPTYLRSWRDLADRLSGRRNRYPRAHRRAILHAGHSRRAGLGRAVLA